MHAGLGASDPCVHRDVDGGGGSGASWSWPHADFWPILLHTVPWDIHAGAPLRNSEQVARVTVSTLAGRLFRLSQRQLAAHVLLYVLRELRKHIVRVGSMFPTLQQTQSVLVFVWRISGVVVVTNEISDGAVFGCVVTSRVSVERNIS